MPISKRIRSAVLCVRIPGKARTRAAVVTIAFAAGSLTTVAAGKTGNDSPAPTADPPYKNLQVMQDTPTDEFLPAMRVFTGALGVSCEHCHQADRASNAIAAKNIARQMITMTRELNKSHFGGATAVTCYTCHHGMQKPETNAVVPVVFSDTVKQPPLPDADELLRRYVSAIAGSGDPHAITSRQLTGVENLPSGEGGLQAKNVHVQIDEKAPNLRVVRYKTDKEVTSEGFDGKHAWSAAADGVCALLSPGERIEATRSADYYGALDLKKYFSMVITSGKTYVGGHEAFEVISIPASGSPETMDFDSATGLLLRRTTYKKTEFGDLPFVTTFGDYRAVGGSEKIAFHRHMTPASPKSALSSAADLTIDGIELNPTLAADEFSCPGSAAGVNHAK